MTINGKIGSSFGHRVSTRTSEPRTSSNRSFNEQVRTAMGNSINLVGKGVNSLVSPIPGAAILSASLSSAATNLTGSNTLHSSNVGGTFTSADGDPASLQNKMIEDNNELLRKQMEVAQITTRYTAESNTIKALHDAQKNIGSNIR